MTVPSRRHEGPGARGRALFLRYWLPLLAYIALIFSGSSVPGSNLPSLPLPNMDKIVHLLEYAVLGLLVGRAIRGSFTGWSPVVLTFATIGLGGMIGLADEIYQGFVPGRQRDPLDWVTDVTAIALAALFAQLVVRGRAGGAGRSASNPDR